jgi:hypothetical protein
VVSERHKLRWQQQFWKNRGEKELLGLSSFAYLMFSGVEIFPFGKAFPQLVFQDDVSHAFITHPTVPCARSQMIFRRCSSSWSTLPGWFVRRLLLGKGTRFPFLFQQWLKILYKLDVT